MKDRRQFLKVLGASGLTSLVPFNDVSAYNTKNETTGFVTNADEHETFLIAGRQAPVTIVVDKKKQGINSISFCYEDIMPGDRIPVHKHLNEAEVIFIQRGSGIFTLGDKEHDVKEGSGAYVPKDIWHGLQNTGTEPIRMIFSFTPSGFEGYFREIGTPVGIPWKGLSNEDFAAIDKKYGIIYKK